MGRRGIRQEKNSQKYLWVWLHNRSAADEFVVSIIIAISIE